MRQVDVLRGVTARTNLLFPLANSVTEGWMGGRKDQF